MYKKIVLNIVLLSMFCVLPFYLLYISQDSTIKMEKVQIPMLLILFLGSLALTYINNKHRKGHSKKMLWIIFEILGIIGLCYSSFILILLYLFRNCCGF